MEQATDTVRTHRVEIVDAKGRVRVVLGWLWEADDDRYGVGVYGDAGSLLSWVAAGADDPEAGIAHGGNVVAVLEVGHDGAGRLSLADANGAPIEG